jgi:hypothetical protein
MTKDELLNILAWLVFALFLSVYIPVCLFFLAVGWLGQSLDQWLDRKIGESLG